MDYNNKVILAPMVRVSTLPFRLLALEYGADLVYCEEIIDFKMINCKRIKNDLLNTIDFCVDGIQKPLFRTCDKEKDKLIFQIGTCDAQRALKVCKLIEDDVAAIDINMGCPKDFSVQGGMGAALLKNPSKVEEIVKTLSNGCKKPISCKIRILKDIDETIALCKLIEKSGAKAIIVHGRYKDERPRHPNHNDVIETIAKSVSIPVIANGGSNEINCHEDIEVFRKKCGVTSVMIARTAMWNCSIFRKDGMLPLDDVIKRYLQICMDTDNFFFNIKYTVQQMLHEELTTERGEKVLASEVAEEIYVLFGMLDAYKKWKCDYDVKMSEYMLVNSNGNDKLDETTNNNSRKQQRNEEGEAVENENEGNNAKKQKICEIDGVKTVCMAAKYVKRNYRDNCSPKAVLHQYSIDNKLPRPIYKTEEKLPERIFKSVLEFNKIKFTTPNWETNKQLTEQSAAICCLEYLEIDYKTKQT